MFDINFNEWRFKTWGLLLFALLVIFASVNYVSGSNFIPSKAMFFGELLMVFVSIMGKIISKSALADNRAYISKD